MDERVWEKTAQFLKELRCEDTGRLSQLQLPEYQKAMKEKFSYQPIYEQTVCEMTDEQKCVIEKYVGLTEQCAEEENQQAYLLILSVIDIRWKKVSVRSLLILLVIAVLCQVLCSKGELRMMVAGGLCGGVFLFLSWFTQESFGYGDSILILILGILSGGWNLLWILFAAFLIASVYGGIMIARKKYTRKNSFPFIPFLTVAYLGGMIGGVY